MNSHLFLKGTEEFGGDIASFVATTFLPNQVPNDDEIKTMVLDPVSWLNNYKVGNAFRRQNKWVGDNFSTIDQIFALEDDESAAATQVYLFGDGQFDSDGYSWNQVFPNSNVDENTEIRMPTGSTGIKSLIDSPNWDSVIADD